MAARRAFCTEPEKGLRHYDCDDGDDVVEEVFSLRSSPPRRKFCRGMAVAMFIVSCAMFVASIIFWVRGSSTMDELSFYRFDGPYAFQGGWRVNRRWFSVESAQGHIGLLFTHLIDTDPKRDSGFLHRIFKTVEWNQSPPVNLLDDPPGNPFPNKFGFSVGLGGNVARDDFWIIFPNWALALLSLLFAMLSYRYLRPRIGKGQCANCGYDLRATPDRCPECGTEAQHQTTLKST